MNDKKQKLLLIDIFNFLHRAFHALPTTLTDSEGNPTNAIYGTTSMLINIFDLIKPDYVAVGCDSKKPTFRVEEFTGYKAQRSPMDEDLAQQIDKTFDVVKAFGIHNIVVDGYEADDVIATLKTKHASDNLEVVIASNDRDLWQLVDKNTLILLPQNKGSFDWVGPREVNIKMGFGPEMISDYKGLKGDPSDNIPGVYGIGDKTAKNLIENYGSIENIYANLSNITPESLRKKLEESYEIALMSKKLATLITDVPIDIELEKFRYKEFNKNEVKKVLELYNFKSLIKRLGFDTSISDSKNTTGSNSDVSSKIKPLF